MRKAQDKGAGTGASSRSGIGNECSALNSFSQSMKRRIFGRLSSLSRELVDTKQKLSFSIYDSVYSFDMFTPKTHGKSWAESCWRSLWVGLRLGKLVQEPRTQLCNGTARSCFMGVLRPLPILMPQSFIRYHLSPINIVLSLCRRRSPRSHHCKKEKIDM